MKKEFHITMENGEYHFKTTDNGAAALKMAWTFGPDIILAEVSMPGMDGYELCAAIKNDCELGGLPVLLLCDSGEPYDEERAARAGVDGVIIKPFESLELITRIEDALKHAG